MHRDSLTKTQKHNCITIVDGIKKLCKRTVATLDAVEEEEVNVRCVGDATSEELPWPAVRRAREMAVGTLVCTKVDEQTAFAKYGVTPVDTKWIDTDMAFEASQ